VVIAGVVVTAVVVGRLLIRYAAYDGALLILGAAGWLRWDVEEMLGENWALIVAECASGELFLQLEEGFPRCADWRWF
jgi:hypothetical protein